MPDNENIDEIMDKLADINDGNIKIQELITMIKDQYQFATCAEPSLEGAKNIQESRVPGLDETADNTFMWVCHYKRIMRLVDMVDDYTNRSNKHLRSISEAFGS